MQSRRSPRAGKRFQATSTSLALASLNRQQLARTAQPHADGLAQVGWNHTLTSGTFGTEPRGDGGPPSPLGPDGFRRGLRRLGFASGIFSGFGVIGPSRYSKPSLSAPLSSVTAITRTWPPDLSLPNSTSSASVF